MKKKVGIYLAAIALTILFGTLMLLGAAMIPQRLVADNVIRSGKLIQQQGVYPRVVDSENASQLDNFTESIIIMQSATMNSQKLDSVFLNTIYVTNEADLAEPVQNYFAQSILEYAKNGGENMMEGSYVRYWGGFRAPVRLLLTVSDLQEIRRLTLFILLTLMALVMGSIGKNMNQRYAMAFAVSIILLKPYIIGQVVDFVCCYYIAFAAMLCVPWMARHREHIPLFFLIIGMLTQYFDFYTSPLTTFGYPMIYLLLLLLKDGESGKSLTKRIFALAGMWLMGYVVMWVGKLTLTSIFTDVNALADGILSFLDRVGIAKMGGYNSYSVLDAFKAVFFTVMGGKKGFVVYCLIGLSTVLAVILNHRQSKSDLAAKIKANWSILVMIVFPVVWFTITAGPIIVHHWFQYRTIATAYFAVFAFAASLMEDKSE